MACKEVNIKNIHNQKQLNIIHQIKNKIKKNSESPKLKIETIQYLPNITFNIVQDGYLIAGTKQRVAKLFVKKILNKNIDTLLYAGTANGFGAVAVGYVAYKLGLKSHVFINDHELNTNTRQINTLLACESKITLCKTYREARDLEYKLSDDPNKKWSTLPNYYLVPMGLNDENKIMVNLLSKQIKKASKNTILENNNKQYRFWCVAGSGGIIEALTLTFPNSLFFIYLTGSGSYRKKVIDWTKHNKNIHILKENEQLKYNYENRKKYYSSVKEYDDLIWSYIKKYGKNDDIIWNVSSDDYLFCQT